jgi:hypothetical protein
MTLREPISAETCLLIPELKLLYAYVPKAACTSIKTWLVRACGIAPEMAREFDEAERQKKPLPFIHPFMEKHYGMRRRPRGELRQALRDPSYFKFTIVRHPLNRLVSAYLDKVVNVKVTAHSLILSGQVRAGCLKTTTVWNWLRGLPLDSERSITFREFVMRLAHCNLEKVDTHYRPQHRLLRGLSLDFTGKLESLVQDFAVVQDRLGVHEPLQWRHTSHYSTEDEGECVADLTAPHFRKRMAPHWSRFFDDSLLATCEQIYGQDFSQYGYQCRVPQLATL